MFKNQQNMLTAIIDILQKAVQKASTNDDPDDVLFSFIDSLGRAVGAEQAFLFDDTPLHFYVWTPAGLLYDRQRVMSSDVLRQLRFWLKEAIRRDKPILIPAVADCLDLPAVVRQRIELAQVRNLALMGIPLSDSRIGAVGLENLPQTSLERAGEMLRLSSGFILMMLKNRDHIYQLRNNSFIDQMTGASNRNAFDAYEQRIDRRQSVGLLFADINNLKKTNDEKGHACGDQLIRDMAAILLAQRQGGEVFRIGGDEFVLVWQPIEEADFLKACHTVRQQFDLHGLDISIGRCWVDAARSGLAPVLKMADQRMYEEKRHSHARGEGGK